jgi:acyl-CoA synthetase (AMP-forming)/AMP-acid ligase II
MAQRVPDQLAIAVPLGKRRTGVKRRYQQCSFRELDEDSSRIASALRGWGVPVGARIALMVRPGVDFISLVFAMLKAGLTIVLIDPGMGRDNLLRCLEEVEPEGFIAIPIAHVVRIAKRGRFPRARWNVTVGRRWFWGGPTLDGLRRRGEPQFPGRACAPLDPAAIIFTTGSTGPPKGVLYTAVTFDQQVEQLQAYYDIQVGEIDLPGFPLFGLFNSAMGVSTIIPDMDPTRPAEVDPENILEAANDWSVTQAFGSPALWNTVGRYCEQNQRTMPTIRRALSAGAPVPPHVIRRVRNAIHPEGDIHTPYGATEALPVASIDGSTVLNETAALNSSGRGVCVGGRFPGLQWKVIRITDDPLPDMSNVEELAAGEIGELIVSGPVVTRQYVTRTEANALHKIADGDRLWHRMGDVGYLEASAAGERFWFCGRKSHRVETSAGPLYTIPCEAILNTHPHIYRSALVGVGERGAQRPIAIIETWPEHRPSSAAATEALVAEVRQLADDHALTERIEQVVVHPGSLPVDIRHNSKIFREQLREWVVEHPGARGA